MYSLNLGKFFEMRLDLLLWGTLNLGLGQNHLSKKW